MAKIFYELRKNTNDATLANGKYYAFAKSIETLNTRKMAQHISEHGSVYTQDVVFGVLEKWRSCMLEMLLEGKRVKIDGLGIFYTTIENTRLGANTEEEYNINKHIKALHIRFLPEKEQELNISSREFLKKASFVDLKAFMLGKLNTNNSGTPSTNTDINTGSSTGTNTGSGSGDNGGNGGSGDGDLMI
ncbi:MAG: HU family DNA-binding protein [Bacteroidaceae bacterium]|nr:HU family DNA-binding protein [Bacteroidaceae bacterium]